MADLLARYIRQKTPRAIKVPARVRQSVARGPIVMAVENVDADPGRFFVDARP